MQEQDFPQVLKPAFVFAGIRGTTEVAPFQNGDLFRGSRRRRPRRGRDDVEGRPELRRRCGRGLGEPWQDKGVQRARAILARWDGNTELPKTGEALDKEYSAYRTP